MAFNLAALRLTLRVNMETDVTSRPDLPVMRQLLWMLPLILVLSACKGEQAERETGFVPAGDGIAMKPLGEDSTGCPMYQPIASDDRMVVQAIHYPDGQGGFTMDRLAADCPAIN